MKIIQLPHLYGHDGIPRGIPSYGQPHSIPACPSLRGNTVIATSQTRLKSNLARSMQSLYLYI